MESLHDIAAWARDRVEAGYLVTCVPGLFQGQDCVHAWARPVANLDDKQLAVLTEWRPRDRVLFHIGLLIGANIRAGMEGIETLAASA